ncbi:unnamed protein product [Danaus chrysippus]|uniref:(African queen) hypothetical protein n=1 Tax=Danaus chrysippus TaxID=151541 RepID=A0A8J2QQQ4_9NEOP|nr:unnamed protein product [Danaus chrysippus]CAG9567328.1 unnamed protein product [Danaus chrysippus]
MAQAREARAVRVTTSTATKRDTESCGQPKGHKPTGELGVGSRAGRRAGAPHWPAGARLRRRRCSDDADAVAIPPHHNATLPPLNNFLNIV